jgi:hypothetical protein
MAPATALASGHHRHHHLTARQKRAIRARLLHEIKHHPGLIRNQAWLRQASLVQFSLPVTIRLNPAGLPVTNLQDNNATLNLGPSLGAHTIGLTGKLHATITFVSAFDAGQPGNVNLVLTPDNTSGLATTSVPLLSNSNVTGAGPSSNPNADGCVGVDTALSAAQSLDNPANLHNDSTDVLGGAIPGFSAPLGDQPNPLTDTNIGTGAPDAESANAGDVVLRTGSLTVGVAPAGTADPASPVAGSLIGQSGGQANLFGLPVSGASGSSVHVKVNLLTQINSILRSVDYLSAVSDSTHHTFTDCRQAWTGAVPNYLTADLTGTIRVAPAITADGELRIATTQLESSAPSDETVAACLVPDSFYDGSAGDPTVAPNATRLPAPTEACNSATSPLQQAGLVKIWNGASNSLASGGSQVVVQGSLNVNKLNAEVLIGTL